jgi:hypothetical protein
LRIIKRRYNTGYYAKLFTADPDNNLLQPDNSLDSMPKNDGNSGRWDTRAAYCPEKLSINEPQ